MVIGQLFWHVGRSHMSPEFFPNPKTFDPSRFGGTGPPPFTYLAFGGGPHLCIGSEYARTTWCSIMNGLWFTLMKLLQWIHFLPFKKGFTSKLTRKGHHKFHKGSKIIGHQ
jgi:cytochrome P450